MRACSAAVSTSAPSNCCWNRGYAVSSTCTAPESGANQPAAIFMRVDFPAPIAAERNAKLAGHGT